MRKLVLIATLSLSLGAWAWAQTDASNMGDSQSAGESYSSYDQTIAAQTNLNSLIQAANATAAASESSDWNGELPGSVASNTGDDFYDQTVAAQANLNSLIQAANLASARSAGESENWQAAQPESMAADVNTDADAASQSADEDFYNQNVAIQASQNSSFLAAKALAASSPLAPEELNGQEPGSMAANEGANEDFYGQNVAIQANVNRLEKDANQF